MGRPILRGAWLSVNRRTSRSDVTQKTPRGVTAVAYADQQPRSYGRRCNDDPMFTSVVTLLSTNTPVSLNISRLSDQITSPVGNDAMPLILAPLIGSVTWLRGANDSGGEPNPVNSWFE